MSEEVKEPNHNENNVPTAEDLQAIKAQLEQETAYLAEAQGALTEKDDTIAKLEAHIAGLQEGFDNQAADLTTLKDAHGQAVTKYLDAVKAANPAIPGDTITGDTIEDIDASAAKANSIAAAVTASLEAKAKETKVPAGAPTRVLDLSALTPDEKIRVGLQQSKIPT